MVRPLLLLLDGLSESGKTFIQLDVLLSSLYLNRPFVHLLETALGKIIIHQAPVLRRFFKRSSSSEIKL